MMCMDVRRALRKDPRCREALAAELASVRGASGAFDAFIARTDALVDAMLDDEYLARPASEALARAIQGVELIRHAPSDVVEAFLATRLASAPGVAGTLFGTMGPAVSKTRADAIVERAHVVR
jgi:putative acyl-CoA dehydrogenase